MQYEIQYHSEKNHPYPEKVGKASRLPYIIVGLLVTAFLIKPCVPKMKTAIRQYQQVYDFQIIPRHLEQGEGLEEALTAFCLNVMRHGAAA